jgi:hypothetical protein
MPLEKPEDHGAGDSKNKYCKYCTDEKGKLKSRDEIREGWIQFAMRSQKKSREQAEKEVDAAMDELPAWQWGTEKG